MTAKEFEQRYADMHFITVDEVRARNLRAIPCNYDFDLCSGWVMAEIVTDSEGQEFTI